MITRRQVLRTGVGLVAAGAAAGSYAVVVEPGFRLVVQRYELALPGWGRPPMTICITADVHAGRPWMPLERIGRIVEVANGVGADLHVLLGDLPAHHRFVTGREEMADVVGMLAGLRAPLGRFAVLGNHDWWDDLATQRSGRGPPAVRGLLERAGMPVLANAGVRLPHGEGVWLLGTDSMLAFGRRGRGADDLGAALGAVGDDAPAILLAHEPDLFPQVPRRVALTLSGHTHGGQIRVLGHSPFVPSRYGDRYAYGVVEEAGRTLVVSGGLGCSMAPVRFGVPPELTVVRLV